MGDDSDKLETVRSESTDETARGSDNKMRRYTFTLFALLQTFVNYDVGAMAVMLDWIQDPYDFTTTDLGILGALPYIGLVLVSPFVGFIFSYFKTKYVLGFGIFLNSVSLMLYSTAYAKLVFFLSRFLVGITQACFIIYAPVWVDAFAPDANKNVWMAILQGSIVMGVMVGYTCTSFFKYTGEWSWRYSISLQAILILLFDYLFLLIPSNYVNINYEVGNDSGVTNGIDKVIETVEEAPNSNVSVSVAQKTTEKSVKVLKSQSFDCRMMDNKVPANSRKTKNINKIHSSMDITTLPIMSKNASYYEWRRSSNSFYTNMQLLQESKLESYTDSFWKRVGIIFRSGVFWLSCITISSIFFELTAIQYWMTKIAINTFNMPEQVIHTIFSIICITSPVLGVMFGSYIIDTLNAKYPNNSLIINSVLLLWAIICLLCGILAVVFLTPEVIITAITAILFFGGCILPPITLISINSMPEYLKPVASSICMCQYHILGYINGTFLPGLAMDIYGSHVIAIYITFLSASVGVLSSFGLVCIELVKSKNVKQNDTQQPEIQQNV